MPSVLRRTVVAALALAACADPAPPASAEAPADPANPLVLSLVPARVELITGYSPQATVRVAATGNGTYLPLAWTVADSGVVGLAAGADAFSAVLTARRPGTTTVAVRGGPGSGGARAEVTIVVTAPPPMPWPPVPPAAVTVHGVTVAAVTRADSSPAGAPVGAVRYTTTATLRNAASEPRTVRLGACPLWITLHGGGSWYGIAGRPLAWDQLGSGRACAAEGAAPDEVVTLAPGASRALRTSVLTSELFGADPLALGLRPNVGYAFHANLRVDSAAVAVDAGSATLTLPTDRLAFRAEAGTRGAARDTLTARVTLTNQGALPAYLEFGACAVKLLAYRTPDLTGAPAWDADLRQPWAGTYGWGCPAYLAARTVAPGAELSPGEFSLAVPLVEMLGDSLPDGRYYFTARARLANAPSPTVAAGALDLALERPPMPSERAYRYVTYGTAGVSAAAGVVRASVTATLTNAGSALVRYPRDCVVRLVAYRDRARRDAAPRSGAPDWEQPLAGCASATQDLVLGRGESRVFETSATAREILGAALPAGRYHFAVYVRAEGRRVFLAAGEVQLP